MKHRIAFRHKTLVTPSFVSRDNTRAATTGNYLTLIEGVCVCVKVFVKVSVWGGGGWAMLLVTKGRRGPLLLL